MVLGVWGCISSTPEPSSFPPFVHRDPYDPYALRDPGNRPLEVVGINRFQIYNPENNAENLTAEAYLDRIAAVGINTVRRENPKRKEFIAAALRTARSLRVPAFLWTHKYDLYGDIDAAVLMAYRSVYGSP